MKKPICGDNLDALKSRAVDTASVDIIYLDRSFNSDQYCKLPFKKPQKDAANVGNLADSTFWLSRIPAECYLF